MKLEEKEKVVAVEKVVIEGENGNGKEGGNPPEEKPPGKKEGSSLEKQKLEPIIFA